MKTMKEWFHMRPGFDTFLLEPETHSRYLFGHRDREHRDHLLSSLEEAAYSTDGYKAAIYGDYGRGKTHQCHNIVSEIQRRALPFLPVYIKCGAYTKRQPFAAFFSQVITRHPTDLLHSAADDYQRLLNREQVAPLEEVTRSEEIGKVMSKGLTVPNLELVRTTMRWLGGESKVTVDLLGPDVKPQLTDSGDFGAVMRGISHLLITICEKVPLYIIDEAERFQNVTDTDTYYSWLASLRELTEIHKVAMLFMIGARTRDFLPTIFLQDEIIRRIGVVNYIEFYNPGPQDLRGFLEEQLQTTILKGPVPGSQMDVIDEESKDTEIPAQLLETTGHDSEAMAAYPFEPDAFDAFVSQIAASDYSNKPSEAQIRLQKAAQRAMRLEKRRIDSSIVEDLANDGF